MVAITVVISYSMPYHFHRYYNTTTKYRNKPKSVSPTNISDFIFKPYHPALGEWRLIYWRWSLGFSFIEATEGRARERLHVHALPVLQRPGEGSQA